VKRLLGRRHAPEIHDDSDREARRARTLIEESRELVLVLDDEDRVVAASRRARESVEGLQEGARAPDAVLSAPAVVVPYEVDGHRERLLYLRRRGDMAAYEELRAGFTAAVSHELRTPLARLLALLETALLPDADTGAVIEQAQAEVGQIGELIDDILFLSELESGRELVGLGSTPPLPLLREVAEELTESAARAGVTLRVEGDEDAELPLRPRMIRVTAENLLENAIRYAGPGTTARLTVERTGDDVVLTASDDGVGVREEDLPRLFERFYRSDRARASRGTGLGLAIVKHVLTSAGGTVEAEGARGEGLTIRCVFSVSAPSPPPR
jgi:two-component system phosphate regulon sensor histidine kinase PhoR